MAKKVQAQAIETVTELRQTIVARTQSWCYSNGYGGSDLTYLTAAGLMPYLRTARTVTVTVNLADIVPLIGEDGTVQVEVGTEGGEVTGRAVALNLGDKVYYAVRGLTLAPEQYTVPEPNPDAIDPREFLGDRWGAYEFAPLTFGSDEVRTEAVRIVTAALKQATDSGACGSVETLIRGVGLETLLPAATTTVQVEVPGFGELSIEVENNRQGQPRMDRLAVKVRTTIAEKITEMVEAGTIAPKLAPATA